MAGIELLYGIPKL